MIENKLSFQSAKSNSVFRIIFYYTGFFFSVLIGLFGVLILTRIVSAEDYGRLSVVIAITSIMQYFIRDTHGVLISRYINELQLIKGTINSLNKYILIFALFFAPLLYLFVVDSSLEGAVHTSLLSISIAIIFFHEAFYLAFKKKEYYIVHLNIFQFSRFFFAFLFYFQFRQSHISLVQGYLIGTFITLCFDFIANQNIYKWITTTSIPSKNRINLNHVMTGSLLSWGILFFDRILIDYFLGSETTGGYFVIFQVGFMPLYLIYYSSFNLLMPHLFSEGTNLDSQRTSKIIILLTVVLIILSIFFYLIFNFLVPFLQFLLGESFQIYSHLFPYMGLYALLFSASNFFSLHFIAQESGHRYATIKAINFSGVILFSLVGLATGKIDNFIYAVIVFYILFSLGLIAKYYTIITTDKDLAEH